MVVLKVELNGAPIATAGTSDLSILTAMVLASTKRVTDGSETGSRAGGTEIELNVSGLFYPDADCSTDSAGWGPARPLAVGDQVVIRVEQSQVAAEPHRYRSAAIDEKQERVQFERVRAEYMRLRAKFEDGV